MLGLKFGKLSVTDTILVPEPMDCVVVVVNVLKVLLVPHSNHADVDAPFGFTLPFKFAEPDVTEAATVVVTVGAV